MKGAVQGTIGPVPSLSSVPWMEVWKGPTAKWTVLEKGSQRRSFSATKHLQWLQHSHCRAFLVCYRLSPTSSGPALLLILLSEAPLFLIPRVLPSSQTSHHAIPTLTSMLLWQLLTPLLTPVRPLPPCVVFVFPSFIPLFTEDFEVFKRQGNLRHSVVFVWRVKDLMVFRELVWDSELSLLGYLLWYWYENLTTVLLHLWQVSPYPI